VKVCNLKKVEMGGLSGKPLTSRSTEVIRFLSEKVSVSDYGVGEFILLMMR
jgi:dihydroorotate dehydrogenase